MTPRVSVVIPSYNHGRFLPEAVESVLASPVDLELIVVDDGSEDDSRAVLRSWEGDPRVRVLLQENRGAHVALNRGLSESRGEILFLLNSDDRYPEQRIPAFLERFEADGEVLTLVSWVRIIDDEGREIGVKHADRDLLPWPRRHSTGLLSELGSPELSLLETNYVSTSSNLAFRRRLLADGRCQFPPLRYTHDWYFALAAATAGPLGIVEAPLIDYRIHGGNTIREGSATAGRTEGEAAMRFEILWTLASHSDGLRCQRVERSGFDPVDLARRQHRSLPPFVSGEQFAQLVHLRGYAPQPPPEYWQLLAPAHPVRAVSVPTRARAELPPPDLSIVIPTRDRTATLERTLDDLARVTQGHRVEVVVVDDGSATAPEACGTEARPGLELRIEARPPRGPAAARNWGIARARAPRVLLLGDDTPLRPGALDEHLDPRHADVGLQGRIDWDPEEPISELMRFLAPRGPQFYFEGLREGAQVPYTGVLGSNLSAPTHWFLEEPFDERFPDASFEDTELAYRWQLRGWTVAFSPSAGAWHRHHYDELGPFLQRQRRAGQAARYALRRHPGMVYRVLLAPALVTALRHLRVRRSREARWDLACRRAFFRGVLSRRGGAVP